jgi:Rps23 Pro-64 3,4-dihydroxylase Tpa1-like proline 4-hydroxylase
MRENADGLRREFDAARPFRHVVIADFLDDGLCRRLMDEFPAFDSKDALNERGEAAGKSVISDFRRLGPAYQAFDRLMRDREFLAALGRVTDIPDLLYDADYIGGGTHENLSGQELDPHVDFNYHPTTGWHRRLNLIVFLNAEWDAAWGGCLQLLRDPWAGAEERVEVAPLANRAVIFETTESSWHGFPRVQLPAGNGISRRSIAVYFYTRERPPQETAPAHGTIYFQRPLPDHLRPGYTLSAEDLSELQLLQARRDQTIQHLYERELKFSRALEAMRNSASFRLGRALTWPLRALRKGR